jgi:predicted dehydrogenase
MNWGIIGLGHMAKNFANSLKELDNSNLTGVSSRSLIKLIKFGYRFKINPKFLYKNYEKLLLSKDIDNIYIGTLNHTHFDLIKKCIDAKKNILCEKPFTINLSQALEIKKKLSDSKNFFLEGIAYRSHPQIKHVIKIINEGQIGKILSIKSSFGFDSGKPNKKGRLFNKDLGGGAILDIGCYPVSMSNLIANLNQTKETIPTVSDIKSKTFETGVDTEVDAKLEYDNGIISEIKISIIKNLDNITIIEGTEGAIKILDPWLPKNENIIEIHKKNEIKKLKISSKLGLFANQINLFEKFANDKTQQNNFYAMSLENSVNCLNVMMQLKEKIINNENN